LVPVGGDFNGSIHHAHEGVELAHQQARAGALREESSPPRQAGRQRRLVVTLGHDQHREEPVASPAP